MLLQKRRWKTFLLVSSQPWILLLTQLALYLWGRAGMLVACPLYPSHPWDGDPSQSLSIEGQSFFQALGVESHVPVRRAGFRLGSN